MNRLILPITLSVLSGILLLDRAAQPNVFGPRAFGNETPERVAGRSISEYASQLNDPDRVVRLRALKSLGAFGPSAADPIRAALEHEDPAMRYTAAVQLGEMGGPELELASDRLKVLATDETSHAVRMAASFALCKRGNVDEHLSFLTESLTYPERGMACSAAELLGRLGPQAEAAIPALEQAYEKHRPGAKGGDYHIGGAANNALRKIRKTPDTT